MIKCECTRPSVNNQTGEIYEVGKEYVIDEGNPRNLKFFALPEKTKEKMEAFLAAEKKAGGKKAYRELLAKGGKKDEGDEFDAMALEELQAKAQELGLEFSAKAKENKLRALIRAALPEESDE
jgi:hypothetical protein